MFNTNLQWCKMCAYMRNICSKTCAKCVRERILILYLCANVANFALFAGAWCERHRICIVRCAILEFSRLTPSLLVMGADSVNFTQFAGVVGELHKFWLIRSNFLGFSVEGQRSETSQLNMDEFYCEMCGIRGICGQIEQILLDLLEF